jgi:hypothetical protein
LTLIGNCSIRVADATSAEGSFNEEIGDGQGC